MLNIRLNYLFTRFVAKQLTLAEKEELMKLIADKKYDEQTQQLFQQLWNEFEPQGAFFLSSQSDDMLAYILNSQYENTLVPTSRSKYKIWSRIAAAAIILTVGAFSVIYLKSLSISKQPVFSKTQLKHEIIPGTNKAILTLSDGSDIALDDASNGRVAEQHGIEVVKTHHGQLVYSPSGYLEPQTQNNQSGIPFNTLKTPRGGQYQVDLPDGTRVWLNAASTLRYPTRFSGGERKVELTGEAYFEVAKNKQLPFKVMSNHQEVEVLGTHFNVNAYADEPNIKTTLLEGSVRVSINKLNPPVILSPGQQATFNTSKNNIVVKDTDGEEAIAWKNGYFVFSNEKVESIMRKLSRWYDVDIEYHGDLSQKAIWGSISRYEDVSQVMQMLQLTGSFHYQVKERGIIIMP